MHDHRTSELLLFLGIMAASALAGLSGGLILPALLAGLAVYLLWHLYRLERLPDIIGRRRAPDSGYRTGLWSGILTALAAREQENGRKLRNLSMSLQRLRCIMASLPDAIIILHDDERIEWANPAAATLLGIDNASAAGRQLASLVSDPILREYLAAGDYSRPLTLSAPVDRLKTLLLQTMTIDTDDSRLVIIARDISRQYHLDVSQRDFIANISHELRTPLTVISGLLEQMEDTELDDSGQHVIVLMQKQAARMRDLIADLMLLMKIESDSEQPPDEPVAIPALIDTIISEARAMDGERGHMLYTDIERSYGLRGNAGELRTVFSNLIVNAIRHTPDRAEIRISWTADAGGARFSVSDTGEGIATRHIPRLTERFYRVDPSRSRYTGGTGLGLAIVSQVLEHHDATLDISSSIGHGSTFTCHFPASRTVPLAGA